MLLFDYTVKRILMYRAEIWGWIEIKKMEKIQKKYFRRMGGTGDNDSDINYTRVKSIVAKQAGVIERKIEN